MLNLTKQGLSADSEVLSLNSNSVFADNKKSHPCESEDLDRIILSSRDSRACGSRMTGKNIGSRMAGKNIGSRMTVKCESGLLSICAADAPQFSSAVYNRGTQARKLQAGATQSGRSMIEMLGVLAIIGVLSVGGIAGYSKAMMQYKINKTVDQISQIVGNVRTLYASQKNYKGLSCSSEPTKCHTLIKKAHLVPDELWNSDGTSLENAFGGTLTVNVGSKKSSYDDKAFGVDLYNLPEEACMALSTYDWGSGSSSGLIAISVNHGTVLEIDSYSVGCAGTSSDGKAIACPNGATVSIPMPINIAATACQTGDSNTVSLKFY
ncbi:MAG: hypothetical protein J6N49_04855 [Alphaproteobacteria bacterium]|nr:hypothetical protein [Alphaproteobacteria bacterium]